MDAETIARALGGRKSGSNWTARCPAHDDRTPSLSITDAGNSKVLVRCHTGCSQESVIAALRSQGLWETPERRPLFAQWPATIKRSKSVLSQSMRASKDDGSRTNYALSLWDGALPAAGTLVEAYLASRGLEAPPPSSLRFIAAMPHPKAGGVWPTMIALVTHGRDGTPVAIHRTFLARDGNGKAPIEPQKMMLGPCGGGCVRLGEIREETPLMVGEGIETCLAAMLATGNPAWAALSTTGLKLLNLPDDVQDVIVLADGDDTGEAAARECAQRWKRGGRRVRIARPPRGKDFNDIVKVSNHE